MDDSFPVEFWHSDLFWLDAPISVPVLAPVRQTSAFLPYLSRPATRSRQENNPTTTATATGSNTGNIHKSVIEYWRKQWHAEKAPAAEKCHRHMLNERMRREKQRQSYLALHSLLPTKTKNDKNSIIQMAARTIQDLKGLEGMLKKRNSELETTLAAMKRQNENGTTPIRVALSNPSSGINSMLAVLNVLKTGGVNTKAIHATFFNSQFSAQLAIDSNMRAAEVERALQLTLSETEKKFQRKYQEGSKDAKESNFNFNNNKWVPRGGSRI